MPILQHIILVVFGEILCVIVPIPFLLLSLLGQVRIVFVEELVHNLAPRVDLLFEFG